MVERLRSQTKPCKAKRIPAGLQGLAMLLTNAASVPSLLRLDEGLVCMNVPAV